MQGVLEKPADVAACLADRQSPSPVSFASVIGELGKSMGGRRQIRADLVGLGIAICADGIVEKVGADRRERRFLPRKRLLNAICVQGGRVAAVGRVLDRRPRRRCGSGAQMVSGGRQLLSPTVTQAAQGREHFRVGVRSAIEPARVATLAIPRHGTSLPAGQGRRLDEHLHRTIVAEADHLAEIAGAVLVWLTARRVSHPAPRSPTRPTGRLRVASA